MKQLAAVLSLLYVFSAMSCTAEASGKPSGGAIDQSTVKGLVEGIFACARSGDLAALAGIADPLEADGDAKKVAGVGQATAEQQADFKAHFGKGKIRAAIDEQGDAAKVPILFGPDGTREEEFQCVRRDGKWYRQSF